MEQRQALAPTALPAAPAPQGGPIMTQGPSCCSSTHTQWFTLWTPWVPVLTPLTLVSTPNTNEITHVRH